MDTKWGMWGGINRETGIDIYTLLGKDYTVNENLQYSTGKKKWRHCLSPGHILVNPNLNNMHSVQFSSVQSLSRVWLFETPWIAACHASLSITNAWSLLKHMSIKSVMPSNHLILLFLSPHAPNPSQHEGLFKWVNSSHEVAKVLEFQLQHQSFQWTPRTDLL